MCPAHGPSFSAAKLRWLAITSMTASATKTIAAMTTIPNRLIVPRPAISASHPSVVPIGRDAPIGEQRGYQIWKLRSAKESRSYGPRELRTALDGTHG